MTAVPTPTKARVSPARRALRDAPAHGVERRPDRPDWRPVHVLVAVYLTASAGPLMLAVARGPAAGWRLAVHVAYLVLTAWGARHRPRDDGAPSLADLVAAWAPLLLIPSLYTELPHVAAGLGGVMHDGTVIRWELALFGTSPAQALAGAMPWRALSEVLHAGYLSYYALIYGPPLLLYVAGRRRAFATSVFTVLLAFVCCYAVFIVFPVQGPWFQWPAPAGLPSGPVRHAVERLLHAGSSRGTAFPSSHVAVSLAQTLVMLRLDRRIGVACGVCTLALALGAVYGGLHYGIDVVVGATLGATVGVVAPMTYGRAVRRSA